MKIEIKNRYTGEVIFSHEQDGNTVESKVSLSGANLRRADLCDADLCGANLRGAALADDAKCDGLFHHLTNVGSEGGVLELYSCGAYGWLVKRGCFVGSLQEFIEAVNKKHGDNEHGKKYRAIVSALCG